MKIILISGKARHGKDTAAETVLEELQKRGHKAIIAHYADLVKYVCRQFFDWNGIKDEAGRTLLQYVGTDIVREADRYFWVDFLCGMARFFDGEWEYMIISDCRFPNEISRWRQKGFDTAHIRVFRPNFDNGLTDEQKNHISETALDSTTPDHVLTNDGTPEDLRASAETIVGRITEESI